MRDTREYSKKYYKRNTKKRKQYITDRQKQIRDIVQTIKVNNGCASCGYRECAQALQYHHPDNNKENNIARMVTQGRALINILNEIEKCVLLCANCHAELHYNRT